MKTKLKKFTMTYMAAVTAVILSAFTSFAAEGSSANDFVAPAATTNDEDITIEEMINAIYENESDPIVKDMAIKGALVLTGCREPMSTYTNGAVLIEKYSITSVSPGVQTMISLIGQYNLCLGTINGCYAVFTSPGEPLSDEAVARNIEDLKAIYNLTNTVKAATEDMDDISKLRYIENILKSILKEYVGGTDSIMARTLETGIYDCDCASALVYLLSLATGLNTKCVSGYTNGSDPHCWNEIIINGISYWHDLTWDIGTESDRYFLDLPSSFDRSERYVVNESREYCSSTTTYYEK